MQEKISKADLGSFPKMVFSKVSLGRWRRAGFTLYPSHAFWQDISSSNPHGAIESLLTAATQVRDSIYQPLSRWLMQPVFPLTVSTGSLWQLLSSPTIPCFFCIFPALRLGVTIVKTLPGFDGLRTGKSAYEERLKKLGLFSQREGSSGEALSPGTSS